MKPFDIEISEITKGPDELTLQLPIQAKIIRQIPGKDRPDYYIAELEKSLIWLDKTTGINKEINYVVLATKKKSQDISNEMKKVILAIAYVIDESVKEASVLDFKKIVYKADGIGSAKKKWGLF